MGVDQARDIPEYNVWVSMKQRCLNPNDHAWRHYGGRGISVCEEWQRDFWAFLRYVGRRPKSTRPLRLVAEYSIDRINNNGNYEPGNVRWATKYEQRANQRDDTVAHAHKLNWELVKQIRADHEVVGLRKLAFDYDVSDDHIARIVRNEVWFDPDYHPSPRIILRGETMGTALLSEQDVIEIWKLIGEGRYSARQIGALYGVSLRTIEHIKWGETWTHVKPTPEQIAQATPRRPIYKGPEIRRL